MIQVTNHEVIKDRTGKIKALMIDVKYTDAVTGESAVWKLSFSPDDFGGVVPTRLVVINKIKERLTAIPSWQETLADGTVVTVTGKSALQRMREEIQNRDTVKRFERGEAGSFVGDEIP